MQQKQRRSLKLGGVAIASLLVISIIAVGIVYGKASAGTLPVQPPTAPARPIANGGNGALALVKALRAHGNAQQTEQKASQGDSTISYEDLTVQSGEIYDTDIIVYSGDVVVEADAQVHGALVIYSGDVVVEEGAIVDGDVIAVSGDAKIAGRIGGAVVVWSGDITLEESATIGGDVSVMSGDIERQSGATVDGNLIVGPKFPKLPPILADLGIDLPGQSTIVEAVPPPVAPTRWSKFSQLMLRLLGSTFLTALVVLMTGLVYYLQPAMIVRLRRTLTKQKPTNFVIGLLLNIVLTILIMAALGSGSFMIALCLAPLSLVATLLFLILNTGGWAALSLIVGERLLSYTKVTPHAFTALLVGATVMTGTITFVWSLGGCMRPLAYLVMLTLTALGGGSLIVQQLKSRADNGAATA